MATLKQNLIIINYQSSQEELEEQESELSSNELLLTGEQFILFEVLEGSSSSESSWKFSYFGFTSCAR